MAKPEFVLVWIQNPFDNLPLEGYRKQRYWLMAEAFSVAGHEVVLWTSDFSHASKAVRRTDPSVPLPFDLRLLQTRPYFRNVGFRRIRSHLAYARTWLREGLDLGASRRPDVIVTSVPTLSAAGTALTLGRRFGARVVVDVMDAWPETFERLFPKGLRPLAHLLMMPLRVRAHRLYREADFVTGVCDRYRDLTGRTDYYRAYHGVEIDPSPSRSSNPARRAGNSLRLVYAGSLGRTYDLNTILRAVAENPDFTLDVAGKWNRVGSDRVRVHGYLAREDLRTLLESCDVGIIPMRDDSWVGMPYKMCDYALAGISVVSSLGGESAALLSKYRCGATYRAGDAQSLAAAIRKAVSFGSGDSRRMCAETFDAGKIYAEYVTAVEKLV